MTGGLDYAVILAGGAGTRLWPLSRAALPKQVIPLVGGTSLVQMAFERAITLVEPDHVLVCTGRDHKELIQSQLPALPEGNILCEPVGRDSLAAMSWSVATAVDRDPDAILAVLSADHVITPVAGFTQALRLGLDMAASDTSALVACAIQPTTAHTGYGYLRPGLELPGHPGVREVLSFVEKPSRELAEHYLAQGWLWNAGIFCWRGRTFLDQVKTFHPEMAQGVDRIVRDPLLIDEVYPLLPKISVDYAIMEPVCQGLSLAHVAAVAVQAQWIDVGSYEALAHLEDTAGLGGGPVVARECANTLIINTTDRLLALCGLDDMVVVQVDDVTLVCPLSRSESVKELAAFAREQSKRYA